MDLSDVDSHMDAKYSLDVHVGNLYQIVSKTFNLSSGKNLRKWFGKTQRPERKLP